MTIDYSKRALFSRKIFTPEQSLPTPLRPPGVASEDRFIKDCTRCDQCIKACAEQILFKGSGGYPEISFETGECTFCFDSIATCEPGALTMEQLPWAYVATTNSQCLPVNGVACQSCQDSCDQNAIEFNYTKTIPTPDIINERCNACGACVSVCPTKAISIQLPAKRDTN